MQSARTHLSRQSRVARHSCSSVCSQIRTQVGSRMERVLSTEPIMAVLKRSNNIARDSKIPVPSFVSLCSKTPHTRLRNVSRRTRQRCFDYSVQVRPATAGGHGFLSTMGLVDPDRHRQRGRASPLVRDALRGEDLDGPRDPADRGRRQHAQLEGDGYRKRRRPGVGDPAPSTHKPTARRGRITSAQNGM